MLEKSEWILSGSEPQQSSAYRFKMGFILKKPFDIINVFSNVLLGLYTKEQSSGRWLFLMYADKIMLVA